jgi:type 1 glutamine amidotransferase
MKFSVPVDGYGARELKHYAKVCGWVLARAHAKSGDAAMISGYLGKTDQFDVAIGAFAEAYADQNERDHATLVAAVQAGRIEALTEDDL